MTSPLVQLMEVSVSAMQNDRVSPALMDPGAKSFLDMGVGFGDPWPATLVSAINAHAVGFVSKRT